MSKSEGSNINEDRILGKFDRYNPGYVPYDER